MAIGADQHAQNVKLSISSPLVKRAIEARSNTKGVEVCYQRLVTQ